MRGQSARLTTTLRSLGAMILAVFAAIVVAVAWTTATAVHLAASALIMGGTEHPLTTPPDDPMYISGYLSNAVNGFINPAAGEPTDADGGPIDGVDDNVYAVVYPAAFFPVFGSQTFDDSVGEGVTSLNGCVRGSASCVYNDDASYDVENPLGPEPAAPSAYEDYVIFGYSQSAVVASLVKRELIADPREPENPGDPAPETSFFLLANPMRPNGGILARGPEGLTIPIIGITFYGATPTNSCEGGGECMPTVDAAAQYDLLGGDAPASLTNVLAIANSLASYYYLHGDLQNENFDDAVYQGSYGDTDYYLYPAERLPILMPFEAFVPSPILTALDAPLRVLIEGAYARDVNPGVATKVGLLPFRNPIRTAINLVQSIPTGLDDGIEEITGDRPLGTEETTSPFGVGGPELPDPPEDTAARTMSWARSGNADLDEGNVVENLPPTSELEPSGGQVEQDPLGQQPIQVIANPTPPRSEATTKQPEEVVVEERIDATGAEKAGNGALTGKAPRVGLKPALPKLNLPKLPKLRGPIGFDSPVRLGPSPANRPDRTGTGANQTDAEPDDPPAGGDTGGDSDAEGAAA
ncbi:PE-PPE domain-containing protein [Mycolicibacterium novocastrense]|uniref:PE-PPE domain-containing protein n=1 Tax=Mycolicibacterium novocastrense TaxID=59813 RepID=A0ABQ0KFT5_MYCNV|nr:PE-PPE domain-containing protein [Mycolicibacterium novocastrense]GAT08335.1 PE-PPE domain-containing protein [Mycolicibacterium novocastrense]